MRLVKRASSVVKGVYAHLDFVLGVWLEAGHIEAGGERILRGEPEYSLTWTLYLVSGWRPVTLRLVERASSVLNLSGWL
jgi:hypothetical protein